MDMAKLERIYTVPLGDAYGNVPRNKRTPRAVKILRGFITKHMKADGEKITISEKLNKLLWEKSIQKPPRKVKVRLIKDDGKIGAYLVDEKIEEPKKEEPKKGGEKKEEPKKAEEKKPKKEEAKEEKPPEKETKKEEAPKTEAKEKPKEPEKK